MAPSNKETDMESVLNAICHRILYQHIDLLQEHGIDPVREVCELVAHYVGEVEEIGTSDVSCWVKEVIGILSLK
jgi:hypothetical protein